MGYANVREMGGKQKKWHDVILRREATMVNDIHDEVIARFTAKGDAYVWALEVSRRWNEQHTLIID